MVKNINNILDAKNYTSEEDNRSLVYICANNPDFDLAFSILPHYRVFNTYADYWVKAQKLIAKNTRLLNHIYRETPKQEILEFSERNSASFNQKESIELFLKDFPIKNNF